MAIDEKTPGYRPEFEGVPLEDSRQLPGEPDGFGRLWTPHRMAYIQADRPSKEAGDGCPFCEAPGKGDADGLIVHRGDLCFVVMNLFPYNGGHLLVCPYRHISSYVDLTEEETLEFSALTKQAVHALKAASGPAGFNIGMNQGEVAGAGVAAHLHQHVVPRWFGDINFMPIIGQAKAVPVLLEESRQTIAAAWPTS